MNHRCRTPRYLWCWYTEHGVLGYYLLIRVRSKPSGFHLGKRPRGMRGRTRVPINGLACLPIAKISMFIHSRQVPVAPVFSLEDEIECS